MTPNTLKAPPNRDVILRDFLAPFALTERRGVEIGPYDRPTLPRDTYKRVEYADVFTTQELRELASKNPKRDAGAVVTVDHVLRDQRLAEAIAPASLDFVFCSHVLEHVPDLIGELQGIERVLRPGGVLLCAYPDRRFTFDIDRAATSLATLRARRAAGATRPDPETVYDYFVHYRPVWVGKLWNGLPDAKQPLSYTPERAAQEAARAAETYVDVHTGVFADTELRGVLDALAASGELGLRVVEFRPCRAPFNEFLFALKK